MSRVPGWERKLDLAIREAARTPFAWGQHDCATFAFDVAGRLTGREIVDWRGCYHDARSAKRYLRNMGGRAMREIADEYFGKPLVTTNLARRGDLVLCREDAYGICLGTTAVFVGEEGLHARPMSDAVLAWRV